MCKGRAPCLAVGLACLLLFELQHIPKYSDFKTCFPHALPPYACTVMLTLPPRVPGEVSGERKREGGRKESRNSAQINANVFPEVVFSLELESH